MSALVLGKTTVDGFGPGDGGVERRGRWGLRFAGAERGSLVWSRP